MDGTNPVRLIVDARQAANGALSGRITRSGGQPIVFSGWLELLQAIEVATEPTASSLVRGVNGGLSRTWIGELLRRLRLRRTVRPP